MTTPEHHLVYYRPGAKCVERVVVRPGEESFVEQLSAQEAVVLSSKLAAWAAEAMRGSE